MDLTETIEYKELGYKIVKCPVCGEDTLNSHWICENCGWEYDGILYEGIHSTCNGTTIKQARARLLYDRWLKGE